jgi:type II secretory pathway pseudopilin PulG
MRRGSSTGFTYLGILFAIALMGVALAAAGTLWSTAAQRDREAQLLFVGHEFRNAIASFAASGPSASQLPRELEDLVQDDRQALPRRHLRRIYQDPMTGNTEWELLRDPDGGIYGVRSKSQRAPIKRANFSDEDAGFAGAECYCDWRFEYTPSRRPVKQRNP